MYSLPSHWDDLANFTDLGLKLPLLLSLLLFLRGLLYLRLDLLGEGLTPPRIWTRSPAFDRGTPPLLGLYRAVSGLVPPGLASVTPHSRTVSTQVPLLMALVADKFIFLAAP